MTDTPTRRQVLHGISTTGAVAMLGTAGAAGQRPSVRLVEAGIRYDLPVRSDYDRVHTDSRPPYTVDEEADRLLVLPRAAKAVESTLATDGVVDERASGADEQVHVVEPHVRTRSLPVSLTARKRVVDSVRLADDHALPTVTLHWNENGAAATVQSGGRIDVPAGGSKTVELAPESVDVRTVTKLDERRENDHVPDDRLSLKTEYGAATVEATPVVEFVDHGTLTLERMETPPE